MKRTLAPFDADDWGLRADGGNGEGHRSSGGGGKEKSRIRRDTQSPIRNAVFVL